MRRHLLSRMISAAAVLFCSAAAQQSACSAVDRDNLQALLNAGAQGFLNNLFTQWSAVKINGLLNVEG